MTPCPILMQGLNTGILLQHASTAVSTTSYADSGTMPSALAVSPRFVGNMHPAPAPTATTKAPNSLLHPLSPCGVKQHFSLHCVVQILTTGTARGPISHWHIDVRHGALGVQPGPNRGSAMRTRSVEIIQGRRRRVYKTGLPKSIHLISFPLVE